MQQFDQAPVEADAIESSLATIVQGSTAPSAFSVGKYIYLKHNGTLDPGLYRVKSAIAQGDTLSSSNLEQDSEGVVNALNGNIKHLDTITIDTSGRISIKDDLANGGSYTFQKSGYLFIQASSSGGVNASFNGAYFSQSVPQSSNMSMFVYKGMSVTAGATYTNITYAFFAPVVQ